MDMVSFMWGVIAVVLVVVAIFLVRALIEIRQTVISARGLIGRIDTELVPTVRELQEILASLKVTADGVASRVEDVKSAMAAVGDTGRNVSRVNAVIGEVADLLSRVTLLSTGVKAAGQYMCDRISGKRG
jgi:uncharacterized protein YoxC